MFIMYQQYFHKQSNLKLRISTEQCLTMVFILRGKQYPNCNDFELQSLVLKQSYHVAYFDIDTALFWSKVIMHFDIHKTHLWALFSSEAITQCSVSIIKLWMLFSSYVIMHFDIGIIQLWMFFVCFLLLLFFWNEVTITCTWVSM